MNRLWIQLSLAFSAAVVISLLIFSIGSIFALRAGVPVGVVVREIESPGGLADSLSGFYAQNQSWNGVESYLLNNGMPLDFIRASNTISISLVDNSGTIIAGDEKGENVLFSPVEHPYIVAATTSDAAEIVPLSVEGQPGGYLRVMATRASPTRPPGAFELLVDYLSRVMGAVAVIAGVVSVIFGVLVSRTLAAPLNRLASAAHAIGQRQLYQRVEIQGTAEIAAVAQAFNDMAERVEQSAKLRQHLVADVAHELRTPLSVIQGNLRAIIDDVYPMSKQEISRLYDQTRLLSRLVNDLHELSQAEANQLMLYPHVFDLTAYLKEQITLFTTLAEPEHLLVKTEIPSIPLWIQADSGRMGQVIGNLLSNALTHTPAGGCIKICLFEDISGVHLSISDTGTGIAAQYLPYIFERFYRVDSGRSRSKGGAGLGLAIARALIHEHGGTIEAHSTGAGQGSIFTIHLPIHLRKPSP